MPFVPAPLYADLPDLVADNACQREAGICQAAPIVEGASEFRDDKEPQKDKAHFNEPGLFPVDVASASSLLPAKKAGAADIKIWAGSSVAIDVDSGTILHYDNGRRRTQIASLTKMMTAVLVMEKVKDLSEEAVVTNEALLRAGTIVGCPASNFCPSNRMYAGEKVRVVDLLKATLINSANDAAAALAIYVAGSEKKFVEMMNQKARELGLKDTNFCTASGLEIDGRESECYSSAYDIARIASYSLKYETIWEIMRIPAGQFYSTDGKYMHELKSTDLIMESTPNYLGVKTGFTPLAGKSLLAGAMDATGKHRIIAVILNDAKRWEDMKTLTDWIFESYNWQ
jgi:D-alanyl-D-alanine carboxypeptidase (penicillin-binding protein 5/6)